MFKLGRFLGKKLSLLQIIGLAFAILVFGSPTFARSGPECPEPYPNATELRERIDAFNFSALPLNVLNDNDLVCLGLEKIIEGENSRELVLNALVEKIIENASIILKTNFTANFHEHIDRALQQAARVFSEQGGAPGILVIPGAWGIGKSSFIPALCSALGVTNFEPFVFRKGEVEFPMKAIKTFAAPKSSGPQELAVVYLSEMGLAASMDNIEAGRGLYRDEELATVLGKKINPYGNEKERLTQDEVRQAFYLLREQSITEFRHAAGNGEILTGGLKSLDELLKDLSANIDNYKHFEEMSEEQKKGSQVTSGQLKTKCSESLKAIESSYPGAFKFAALEKLGSNRRLDLILKDPDELIEEMRVSAKANPATTKTIGHTLLIFDFNPDELLKASMRRTIGQGPDAFHADVKKTITPQALYDWFVTRWGEDQAFISRMGVRNWRMMLPFDVAGWEDFFRRNFKKFESRLNLNLGPLGIRAQVVVDDKLMELFKSLYMNTTEDGLRLYYQNGDVLLADLLRKVSVAILKDSENLELTEQKTIKLQLDFESSTNSVTVSYINEVEVPIEEPEVPDSKTDAAQVPKTRMEIQFDTFTKLDIGVLPNDEMEAGSSPEAVSQKAESLAIHQAATAVVGMGLLGTMPRFLDIENAQSGATLSSGWSVGGTNLATNSVRAIMLGAPSEAQRMFDPLGGLPPILKGDLVNSGNVIREVFQLLEAKIGLYGANRVARGSGESNKSGKSKLSRIGDNSFLGQVTESFRDLKDKTVRGLNTLKSVVTRQSPEEREQAAEKINEQIEQRNRRRLLNFLVSNDPTETEFYEAVLDLGENAVYDLSNPKFHRVISIMHERSGEILEKEQDLFSAILHNLKKRGRLESHEIRQIVSDFASDELRDSAMKSSVGGVTDYRSPLLRSIPYSERQARRIRDNLEREQLEKVNRFRKKVRRILVSITLGASVWALYNPGVTPSDFAYECRNSNLLMGKVYTNTGPFDIWREQTYSLRDTDSIDRFIDTQQFRVHRSYSYPQDGVAYTVQNLVAKYFPNLASPVRPSAVPTCEIVLKQKWGPDGWNDVMEFMGR